MLNIFFNRISIFYLPFTVVLLLCSCQKQEAGPRRFLFLGHPYDWAVEDQVDPRLERLDYRPYEEVWLGGDVCARTAKAPGTMDYLDSIFGLQRTRWALGNHDWDYGERGNVLSRLPNPPFYTAWMDGFTLTVLNTNLFWYYDSAPPQDDCAQKARQWQMLQRVADTLQAASHWVILHHHALLNELKVDENGDTSQAFNVNAMKIRPTCDSTMLLTEAFYPRLRSVKERGIQPVLIGGDLGMRAKAFAYQTAEGIWLLGSGINNSVPRAHAPEYVTDFSPDQLLELRYQDGQLGWHFFELGEEK